MSLDYGSWDITNVAGDGDSHNKGYYTTSEALNEAWSTANPGDYAIVGATNTIWVWDEQTSTWVDTDTKGQVTSVNSKTGAVVLTAADVGALYTGGKNVTITNNVVSADQYPIFCVNSGNVDSSGEGDLIGTATYDNVSSDYFSTLGGTYSRDGNVITRTSNDVIKVFSMTDNNPEGKPWKIKTKIKSTANTLCDIGVTQVWAGGNGFNSKDYFEILNNNVRLYINDTFQSVKSTGINPSAQLTYIDCGFTGTQYFAKLSIDNETWEELTWDISTATIIPLDPGDWVTGTISNGWDVLDLSEFMFEIDGQEVWRAVDSISTINSLSFKVGGSYPSVDATNGQSEQFTVDTLSDLDLTSATDGDYIVFVTPEGTCYANKGTVYIQNNTPVLTADDIWFNTSKYPYVVTKGDIFTNFEDVPIATFTIATQANGSKLLVNSKTLSYNRSTLFPLLTQKTVELFQLNND